MTTGTFTIPLMKRVGFSSEQAGSVEVASSVNGQIMPPVMGAAAFLMVEYVGISYVEVITHAFLPAAISYIALVYIVHLEAVKRNMPTLGDRVVSMGRTIGGMALFFCWLCRAVLWHPVSDQGNYRDPGADRCLGVGPVCADHSVHLPGSC